MHTKVLLVNSTKHTQKKPIG